MEETSDCYEIIDKCPKHKLRRQATTEEEIKKDIEKLKVTSVQDINEEGVNVNTDGGDEGEEKNLEGRKNEENKKVDVKD